MSKAHDYLRTKMESYNENSPPDAETLRAWRHTFDGLLDGDMKSATTHEERVKLKALGIAGGHCFDRMGGGGSTTALETFNDMVGIARGERNATGLAPVTPRRAQRAAQDEWNLAVAAEAIREGLDGRPNFEKWLRASTGKSVVQVRKLMDNMDQEKGPYEVIKRNRTDIRSRLDKGERWMFDEIEK
jgi:hypothetical protein